jgi:hypothetical protein
MSPYNCPECDDIFGSLEGVCMHYLNKQDGEHTDYSGKFEIKTACKEYADMGRVDSPANSPADGSKQPVSDGGVRRDRAGGGLDAGGDSFEDRDDSPDDSGAYSLPEFETPDDSPDDSPEDSGPCCDSPEVVGEVGEAFHLDQGGVIRLDAGEQICLNCEEIQ